MTSFIYAVVFCIAAGDGNYCHLMGGPMMFRTAEECREALTHRFGPGNYIGGKFYSTAEHAVPGAGWGECDQRPVSDWVPVRGP